jgi:hypothetical protein
MFSIITIIPVCACEKGSANGTGDTGNASADSNGSTGASSAGSASTGSDAGQRGEHDALGGDGNHTEPTKDMPTLCDYWRMPWCTETD